MSTYSPPTATPTIRLLLVDDHLILREGLAAVLERDPSITVVGQTGDGKEAVDLYRTLTPDVCIIDIRMTPTDGVQTTEAIRAIDPEARIILLSTYDTDEEVFRGLRAGASSFLLKDIGSGELVDTIRTVYAGRKSISHNIAAKLADHVASDSLTPRQKEVLLSLAQGLSNMEIANALFISEGTVKAHVKAILHKLDARDRTQAITIGIRRGLVRPL